MKNLLNGIHTIAIVGLSEKPDRPSFVVAKYLQLKGFKIVPVNPNLSGWEGAVCYPSIEYASSDNEIDLVNIFRRSDEVMAIVKDAVDIGNIKIIWMQEGVFDIQARNLAVRYGMVVVMDTCIMKYNEAINNN